jgi:hypothetical protein
MIDQNKTASSLNIKERYQVFCSLKESKYTLLKAEHKLSNTKKFLKSVKESSPTRGIMPTLKSEFHDVFEDSKYLGAGTLKLIDWLNKAQPY